MSSNVSSNKKILKNTVVLNIRLVVTLIISLYASRLVLKVLGVEDYGLYNLIGGFVSMLSIVTNSITGTISRFITFVLGERDEEKLSKTFSSSVNAIIIMIFVVIFIAALLGPWFISNFLNIPADKIGIAMIVFFASVSVFVLNLFSVPYISLITAHEHMNFYAIMSVFDSLCKLSIIIFLQYVASNTLILYSSLLVLQALLSRIIYSVYCSKQFPEAKYRLSIDKSCMRNMLSFSIWMGVGSAAGVIKDQGGNILLNMFFGLILNAAMGVATQVKSLIVTFGNAIGMAISPQITKSYAAGDFLRSCQLTFLLAKCQGIVMLIIIIPILLETHFLLEIWLGEVPQYTISFVRLIMFVCFFNILAQGFAPLFLAYGKIRNYQLFGTCLMILYVPLSYMFLKLTNNTNICLYVGIGIEFIFMFTNYLYLKISLNFPILDFFKNIILKVLIIMLLSLLLIYSVEEYLGIVQPYRFICSILFSLVSILILCYLFILNKDEKQKIISLMQKRFLHVL